MIFRWEGILESYHRERLRLLSLEDGESCWDTGDLGVCTFMSRLSSLCELAIIWHTVNVHSKRSEQQFVPFAEDQRSDLGLAIMDHKG